MTESRARPEQVIPRDRLMFDSSPRYDAIFMAADDGAAGMCGDMTFCVRLSHPTLTYPRPGVAGTGACRRRRARAARRSSPATCLKA